MSSSATIKSFTLNLDNTVKGNPKPVTMSCVYSYNDKSNMGIGYVLAIDGTIQERRCSTLGLQGEYAFMNTDRFSVQVDGGQEVKVYRLGFSDNGHGLLSGYMMQGDNGDDIIGTKGLDESFLKASWSKKE